MRTKRLLRAAIAILAGSFVATGCIDENYDLSNVDTTAELQIKDLVLPLNIDEIAMHEIIPIGDTSLIQVINGEYVLIDSGTYESNEIIVPAIVAKAPRIAPINSQIKLIGNDKSLKDYPNVPEIPNALSFPLRYNIGKQMSRFAYQEGNVSDFIVSVDKIFANFDITIDLFVDGLQNSINSFTMEDLRIQLPKGLTGEPNMGIYDPETGVVTIGSKKVEGITSQFKMSVTEVDIAQAGAIFENHSFSLIDSLGISAGQILVEEEDAIDLQSLMQKQVADFRIQFAMEDMCIEALAGVIQYSIDGLNIADIPITGIPTILSQDSTNLLLENPQIYIDFSNPLGANFGLYAQTGLTLTAMREGYPDKVCSVETFKLACPGCIGCQFCLSPIDPGTGNYWGKFINAQHISFPGLSEILSGNGLPEAIGIRLDNPCIPKTHVKGFPIGVNMGRMKGSYTIFAPLQLKEGSQIVYSGTEKGWWTEDMDNLSIKYLQIDALITNNLPVDVEITGYPIDREGNKIEDVTIEGFHLETGVEGSPLHIEMAGKIEHLDGITFVAKAKALGESLKPEEHIIIKNLKVKVSGSYISEL
ncbi:MAG: hypothetical protein IKV32_00145 [Muribaculaceae bacterium]|nr:hypothetical protein [Muribaculaceae bacterium]